jgi:hypothetical protein
MVAQTTLTNDQIFLDALDALDRDARIAVGADALLYGPDEQCENIYIVNLSRHGIRAKCDLPPLVGEAVRIELAGAGMFEGVVRWQNQNNFGVHVFETINLRLFSNPQEY